MTTKEIISLPPEPPKPGNFLGYTCRNCGRADRLHVEARVWVHLGEDGTDADAKDCGVHDYDPESHAYCKGCGKAGPLRELVAEIGEDGR